MVGNVTLLLESLGKISGKPPVPVGSDSWTATCPVCGREGLVISLQQGGTSIACNSGRCDPNVIMQCVDHRLSVGTEVLPDGSSSRHEVASSVSYRKPSFSEGSQKSVVSEVSLGLSDIMGSLGTHGVSGGTNGEERLLRAIQESLPTAKRSLNRLAFGFARHLKSVSGFKRSWAEVDRLVEAVAEVWHDLAGEFAPDLEEFQLEVFDIWDNVRTSIDDSPLKMAIEVARARPYRPGELSSGLAIVAALCRELADPEEQTFYLSGKVAAEAAEKKQKRTGRQALNKLQAMGFIQCIESGDNRPGVRGRKAARYRWIGPVD
jgi:hypothetical protein